MKRHNSIKKALGNKVNVLENTIHCQIAEYLNLVIKRPSRWHTVEVSNQQSGKAGMFKQIALKKRGVVTGWPDIEIFAYFTGGFSDVDWWQMIFLEVKAPGGKLTEKQEALHKELKEDGHYVYVVHSAEDVQSILKELSVI